MTENTMVLWKYCLTDDLPERNIQTGIVDTLDDHVVLHAHFKTLTGFLYQDTRDWSLARAVADKKDVEPLPGASDGWFRTLCYIPSEEGYFPQYEAEKKYEDYLKND